jgi:hypothetical protein
MSTGNNLERRAKVELLILAGAISGVLAHEVASSMIFCALLFAVQAAVLLFFAVWASRRTTGRMVIRHRDQQLTPRWVI